MLQTFVVMMILLLKILLKNKPNKQILIKTHDISLYGRLDVT